MWIRPHRAGPRIRSALETVANADSDVRRGSYILTNSHPAGWSCSTGKEARGGIPVVRTLTLQVDMCRKRPSCSELGPRDAWSSVAPLPVPVWMQSQVLVLGAAMHTAAVGNRSEALSLLDRIDSDALRDWGAEHGQVAGIKRCPGLRKGSSAPRLKRSFSKGLRLRIHARDGYHCRYCSMPVISRAAIKAFARYIDGPAFTFGDTIASRHGAALLATAQLDHVIPYSAGGSIEEGNLVTACWTCQFGKDGYTLDQLGIDDPRLRPPLNNDWDGASSCTEALQRLAAHRSPGRS